METRKAYLIALITQLIYTGMFVVTKAAFNHGINTFVFIFYRQAAASILLLPIALLLERCLYMLILPLISLSGMNTLGTKQDSLSCIDFGRSTFSLNLYNVSLQFTSATVASATTNSMPVVTFCFALLLRMEVVKLRNSSGMAKLAGVSLCLAGVFVIAFYAGPAFSPVNHHRAFTASTQPSYAPSRERWIKGTFLMVLSNMTWSLWIVMQAGLLKEYPNKMLVTVMQCVFSALQSFVVAVVAERDFSRWKLRLDVSFLAIVYTGFVVTGVSYYLQAWCVEMKGPVFYAAWTPLCFVFTMFCSSFFLGEIVHLGSIIGGVLLVGGLYSVLWGKSKETNSNRAPCNNELNIMDDADCPKSQENEEKMPSASPTEEV
ncbi:hypothetical protein PR202_ga10936 [Eleusine coracana subsp. coracana]|uniref:WAT1-related protein n=1 Tax=Eleusine coracana subsp. coracana TaxID=191504 RepID=A0AAV5C817_ELECO|nr:hypothetical protein PR202_ga10936 [Eleusine coracana subsp. coracana]